ncbi:conserved hypothetical protein, secreted [Candidatus Magnetomorum sp. HK-1]|nr:conserved hypothetical protein, secreted [Candidatus Magnetomorum sp. HK-1]
MLLRIQISFLFFSLFSVFLHSCAPLSKTDQIIQENKSIIIKPKPPVTSSSEQIKKDSVTKEAIKKTETNTFDTFIQQANNSVNKKQFKKALDFAKQALEYAQSHYKMQSEERVKTHQLFAEIYLNKKNYPAAEKHYQQAYHIQKNMLGERNEKTLNLRNKMGQLYQQWGKLQKAEQTYKLLNKIYQDIFGNNHRKTLSVVDCLAKLYISTKQYAKARPYATQAIKICEHMYGKNSIRTLDAVIQAGKTYYHCKAYVRAFNTLNKAFSLIYNNPSVPFEKKIDIYQFLAELHQMQKRLKDAEDMYKKTIALCHKVRPPRNDIQLQMNQKLSELYKKQGRYQEAKMTLLQSIKFSGTVFGKKHPKTIAIQHELVELLWEQKDYGHAAEILSEALKSSKELYGEHHEKTFVLSRRLAEIFIAQARYQEAESIYQTNLTVQKKILASTRENLKQLGHLFKMQENCSSANSMMEQAFHLNEATLGPAHPETLESLLELMGCMVEEKQHNHALELLKRIEKPLFQKQLELSATPQKDTKPSPNQDTKKLQKIKLNADTFCDAVFSLMRSMNNQEAINYTADVMLRWQYLKHFPAPERKELPGYHDINALFNIQMLNLPYRLPRNSAFFSIYPYDNIDFAKSQKTETRWLVILILSEQNESNMFCQDLGPINVSQKFNRQLMHSKDQQNLKDIESRLYSHLFGIFEEHIKNVQSIYISTNGLGHMIPYSRLRLKDGRFWIERQHLCRVFSALDFLKNASHVYTGSLLAIGQVNYDDFKKNLQTDTLNEKTFRFPEGENHIPLPKTRQAHFKYRSDPNETPMIEEIMNIYTVSRKASPIFWSDTDANEADFKKLVYPPRVLHFSVDCFYLDRPSNTINVSGGLALAGANKGFINQTDSFGQDGLLLDIEILDVNLKGTELVCLSKKCDGNIKETNFSPFFQMAAAFNMAGCRFVLSPAWSVKQEPASVFLIRFYENWLRQSISNPSKALRKTKLQHIAENIHPKIWSSYVLMGF